MRSLYFFLLFGCFSLVSFAQTFKGAVYGSKGTLEGVVIKNQRTRQITTTDLEGQFAIKGKMGDSLSFQFFTYEDTWVVLDEKDTTNFVVELTAVVNLLEEVVLTKEKKFNSETFTKTFKSDIAIDMELHPEKYQVNTNPNRNLNFISIGKVLIKLLIGNRPPRVKPPPKIPITLDQYLSLFKEDRVINDTFLVETLHIPLDKKPLFIDFCISQQLDATLLEEKRKFLLIDRLINLGREFLELSEEE